MLLILRTEVSTLSSCLSIPILLESRDGFEPSTCGLQITGDPVQLPLLGTGSIALANVTMYLKPTVRFGASEQAIQPKGPSLERWLKYVLATISRQRGRQLCIVVLLVLERMLL